MSIEKILYTATATASGGREGQATSSDGVLAVKLSTPRELGGAGGDGTVRACVQAVFEEEAAVSIGLVPIGTGNILARNLKLPINNLDKCIKRSVSGDTYEIDLGVAKAINQHGELTKFYFTGIAGIGMDARIMQRTLPELKRRVGWIAYLEGGLRSLPMKFEKFEVLVDDQAPRNLKSYSILIGNAGWLPGQISMMPDASWSAKQSRPPKARPRAKS